MNPTGGRLRFAVGELRCSTFVGNPPLLSLVEKIHRLRQAGRVKLTNFLVLLLGVALLAGCEKSDPQLQTGIEPVATPQSIEDILPKQAQAKLPTMKLYLGAEVLDAELALTAQQEMTGMMYRTNIQDTDAMLFVLPVPQRASFWMKNCPESISAAYIGTDGVIREIHHLEQNDTNQVVSATSDIQFVLETSEGWFTPA